MKGAFQSTLNFAKFKTSIVFDLRQFELKKNCTDIYIMQYCKNVAHNCFKRIVCFCLNTFKSEFSKIDASV